ncbi:protein OSCP1-like [Boleophthalmus pectinirostris]|uniref:protein OSCP1-like n=1 Tax=Boleophthalmus pectinirostris TaxID=150288 RepID=UPI002430D980|nr:protein OSCP1-like [Boleophthalmus pectinirostris]
MSTRALPLVFINLGGEMLYILDQRLQSSNTTEDGSEKGLWTEGDRRRVLNDIVGTLFSKAFLDELFKPQQLYSHRTMKTVLSRLAQGSIMRLNPASMDRLYELMVMGLKYQVWLCPRPKDLLLISYNHLDSTKKLVQDTPTILNQVHEAHRRVIEAYTSLSPGELQLLRHTLLNFFEDFHIRVSFFLKTQIQNPNGRFVLGTSGPVPQGVQVPGLIRVLDCRGRELRRWEFPTGGDYTSAIREGSFDLYGDRVLKLGLNIYTMVNPEETHTSKTPAAKTESRPNLLAKEELNLLSRLMGTLKSQSQSQSESGSRPGPEKSFRINLFPSDQEEDEAGAVGGAEEPWSGVINIQASQDVGASSELAHILGQFTEKQEKQESETCSKGDELLALMDQLG